MVIKAISSPAADTWHLNHVLASQRRQAMRFENSDSNSVSVRLVEMLLQNLIIIFDKKEQARISGERRAMNLI